MELQTIQQKIFEVRGIKVMLDFDLAELFGVETKALNQAVKRNSRRFPSDYIFRLTVDEWKTMRSHFVTASPDKRNTRATPFAFTEHGVVALPFILRSERAEKMSDAIVRAFVSLRTLALTTAGLADYVRLLEEKYDKQFADIYEALNYLMAAKKNEQDWDDRNRIGFVREEETLYVTA